MANVNPNSTIRLLHNCPLDKTYDHTIYFTNATDQANYFSSLAKYTFTNYSYVRQNRSLKVQANVGQNLYDCNYMMFKNTSFENKWFYAFITHVEYDNNLTWIIDFQLDVMQTWFFDYELEPCFVEREHTATDEFGENLIEEPNLPMGEYVCDGIERCKTTGDGDSTSWLRNLSLVFGCTFNDDPPVYTDYSGGYYCGMYSALHFKVFDIPDNTATAQEITDFTTAINTWIRDVNAKGKIEGIVTSFVVPKAFVGNDGSTPTPQQFVKRTTFANTYGIDPETNQPYIPKNKKLYTYPYNFLYCTNFQGQSTDYRYEYFSDPTNAIFELQGNFTPDPTVLLMPMNYKGVTGTTPNYDERMTLMGYPQVPFSNDVYKAWLAQSAGSTLVSTLASMLMIGAGAGLIATGVGAPAGAAMAGAGAGALVPIGGAGFTIGSVGAGTAVAGGSILGSLGGHSLISTVSNFMGNNYKAQIAPNTAHNGAGSLALASQRLLDFGFMRKHIRIEYAKAVDDYFNLFGYACKRCKVPNRAVRPHWTYVKTGGCCIKGSVPAEDMSYICNIYDNGITFWRNGSEVGQYNLNNAPVSN